jgi:hypothetical protein
MDLKTKNMNYEEYLILSKPYQDGLLKRYMFNNGYGASVVSHSFSYGGNSGLFELAVLDKNGELTYDTSITNDVIGHLTQEEVYVLLGKIKNLSSPSEQQNVYYVDLKNKPHLKIEVDDKTITIQHLESTQSEIKLNVDILANLVDTLIQIQNRN